MWISRETLDALHATITVLRVQNHELHNRLMATYQPDAFKLNHAAAREFQELNLPARAPQFDATVRQAPVAEPELPGTQFGAPPPLVQ